MRPSFSWKLQTFSLSKKGPRCSKFFGGVVKTLRRSNPLFFVIAVVFLVRKGPLGWGGLGRQKKKKTVGFPAGPTILVSCHSAGTPESITTCIHPVKTPRIWFWALLESTVLNKSTLGLSVWRPVFPTPWAPFSTCGPPPPRTHHA